MNSFSFQLKSFFLFIGFANIFFSNCVAQGVWTQKANFPGRARTSATGFSVNGRGYITLGTDPAGPNYYPVDLWEYNPISNSWIPKSNFPGAGSNATPGFPIGTKGYIGTGYNGTYPVDFWEWNQATDT